MMKLHFEPNLDYQKQAIEAVCDLFRGQEVCRTEFTVTMKAAAAVADDMPPGTVPQQMTLGMAESDLGIGNRLTLLDDELHKNLADIQLDDDVPPMTLILSVRLQNRMSCRPRPCKKIQNDCILRSCDHQHSLD